MDVIGVLSSYACAIIADHPSVAAQTEAFEAAVQLAEKLGARLDLRHSADSAATVTNPATHYDLVRLGIATYVLSPLPGLSGARDLGLQPAMTMIGRVANVRRVAAGQGVSYWHTYLTPAPTTLAVVPLGYADG